MYVKPVFEKGMQRRRALRQRPLHDGRYTDAEIEETIDGLLRGDPVAALPTDICQAVVTTMTQMRKDALLQKRDGLAAKLEIILNELKYGPDKFENDTPGKPELYRSRNVQFIPTNSQIVNADNKSLKRTSTTLMRGARLTTVDIPTRQNVEPVLKTRRVTQVSRTNYTKSSQIDRTVDNIIEYDLDSRRIAPRLLKVQEIEAKLADCRAKYEDARQRMKVKRQQYEELEKAEAEKLEHELKDQLLDFGSHVPTSLPLEYSKFSNKVLDARVREHRSAQIRKYDDAQAIRSEALKREKQELEQLSERFTRSFKLQRQFLLKKQDERRESFKILWKRKMEKNEQDCARTMAEMKQAVENLERELAEARRACGKEIGRIRNNERINSTPTASKAAVPIKIKNYT